SLPGPSKQVGSRWTTRIAQHRSNLGSKVALPCMSVSKYSRANRCCGSAKALGSARRQQLLAGPQGHSRASRNVIRACEETFGIPLLWPDAEDAAGCHGVNYTPEYGTRNVCAWRPTRPE